MTSLNDDFELDDEIEQDTAVVSRSVRSMIFSNRARKLVSVGQELMNTGSDTIALTGIVSGDPQESKTKKPFIVVTLCDLANVNIKDPQKWTKKESEISSMPSITPDTNTKITKTPILKNQYRDLVSKGPIKFNDGTRLLVYFAADAVIKYKPNEKIKLHGISLIYLVSKGTIEYPSAVQLFTRCTGTTSIDGTNFLKPSCVTLGRAGLSIPVIVLDMTIGEEYKQGKTSIMKSRVTVQVAKLNQEVFETYKKNNGDLIAYDLNTKSLVLECKSNADIDDAIAEYNRPKLPQYKFYLEKTIRIYEGQIFSVFVSEQSALQLGFGCPCIMSGFTISYGLKAVKDSAVVTTTTDNTQIANIDPVLAIATTHVDPNISATSQNALATVPPPSLVPGTLTVSNSIDNDKIVKKSRFLNHLLEHGPNNMPLATYFNCNNLTSILGGRWLPADHVSQVYYDLYSTGQIELSQLKSENDFDEYAKKQCTVSIFSCSHEYQFTEVDSKKEDYIRKNIPIDDYKDLTPIIVSKYSDKPPLQKTAEAPLGGITCGKDKDHTQFCQRFLTEVTCMGNTQEEQKMFNLFLEAYSAGYPKFMITQKAAWIKFATYIADVTPSVFYTLPKEKTVTVESVHIQNPREGQIKASFYNFRETLKRISIPIPQHIAFKLCGQNEKNMAFTGLGAGLPLLLAGKTRYHPTEIVNLQECVAISETNFPIEYYDFYVVVKITYHTAETTQQIIQKITPEIGEHMFTSIDDSMQWRDCLRNRAIPMNIRKYIKEHGINTITVPENDAIGKLALDNPKRGETMLIYAIPKLQIETEFNIRPLIVSTLEVGINPFSPTVISTIPNAPLPKPMYIAKILKDYATGMDSSDMQFDNTTADTIQGEDLNTEPNTTEPKEQIEESTELTESNENTETKEDEKDPEDEKHEENEETNNIEIHPFVKKKAKRSTKKHKQI